MVAFGEYEDDGTASTLKQRDHKDATDLVAETVRSHPRPGSNSVGNLTVAHTLRADGFDASEDGTGRGTPLVPIAFDTPQITSKANRSQPQPGDPCHPLAAGAFTRRRSPSAARTTAPTPAR